MLEGGKRRGGQRGAVRGGGGGGGGDDGGGGGGESVKLRAVFLPPPTHPTPFFLVCGRGERKLRVQSRCLGTCAAHADKR